MNNFFGVQRLIAAGTLALLVAVFVPTPGPAQPPDKGEKPKPDQQRPDLFKGRGKIESIGKDEIKMTTAEGEHWTLKLRANSKVRVMGQAELGSLAKDEYLQFNSLLDKKANRLKGPVQRATLFTPSQEFSPGLFPDTSDEAQAAVAEAANADIKSPWKAYVIAGQLVAAHGRKLILSVPGLRERLRVELTEGARIEYVSEDLGLAKAGDRIEAMGRKTGEGTANLRQARIRLAEPLARLPKHKPAGKPSKQSEK